MRFPSRNGRANVLAGLLLALAIGWAPPSDGGGLVTRGPVDIGPETSPAAPPSAPQLVPQFESVPAPGIALPVTGGVVIKGAQGGHVTVGRFTIDIPPGAFKGTASILITVPDPHRLQCTLDVLPKIEAFDQPVKLTVDGAGGDVADANDWVLVTYDEKAHTWTKLPGGFGSAATMTVTGWLPHFSLWGVVDSKAGW